MLQSNPGIDVFCHPGVVRPRYSIRNRSARPVHMPRGAMAALDKIPSQRMHWVPIAISEDIGLTGPIPRKTTFEDTGGPFFLDLKARCKDVIEDEAALWIKTSRGLVVFTGCCHAGLINTLTHARKLSGVSTVRAVIGGFHLLHAGPERIMLTLSELKDMAPAMIVACHCTGDQAVCALEEVFNNRVSRGFAGMRLEFE